LHKDLSDTDFNATPEIDSEKNARQLSHDIRTAIHGLMGYVEIIRQELDPKLEASQQEMLKRINVYSAQVIDLVYELMSKYEEK
jgi:K+-sensing histidine kinase KdpD